MGGVFTKMYQQTSTEVSYGTADYFRLTVERLKVQQQLLETGVHVVVIEADATWFRDAERVENLLRSELPRHHIVSADDTGEGRISANFLAIAASNRFISDILMMMLCIEKLINFKE